MRRPGCFLSLLPVPHSLLSFCFCGSLRHVVDIFFLSTQPKPRPLGLGTFQQRRLRPVVGCGYDRKVCTSNASECIKCTAYMTKKDPKQRGQCEFYVVDGKVAYLAVQ